MTALPLFQEGGVDAVSFRAVADKLGVTPMAVAYHSGSKKNLLTDLVDLAFKEAIRNIEGDTAILRVRSILRQYCTCALKNAHLLRAILEDTSLMSADLVRITDELRNSTQQLNSGDDRDVLLHLLVDYTHGFVLSAASGENNPLTEDDFLRCLDWVLARALVSSKSE